MTDKTVALPFQESVSTANVLTGGFQDKILGPVQFYDNTLREGEQPPGVVFSPDEKLRIAHALSDFGCHWANVGFPAVSKEEFESVAQVCRAGLRMRLAALARCTRSDIDIAADAGVDLVSLFLGSSDTHLRDKLRMTEDEAVERIHDSVSYIKSLGKMAAFAVEDGSRTPLPRILRMLGAAAEAGADYVVFADTAGALTPSATHKITEVLVALIPSPLALHFHNDLGLAHANALAGLEAGAQMVQVTVNGVGERSGNTCLEELAVCLKLKYGLELGFDYGRLHELCSLVHAASGTEAAPHKAIDGKWCFTHESGIHVAGVLANPETYQCFPPSMVGRSHEVCFGKHSGVSGIDYVAKANGLTLSTSAAREVLALIKGEAESSKSMVPVQRVLEWIRARSDAPVEEPAPRA